MVTYSLGTVMRRTRMDASIRHYRTCGTRRWNPTVGVSVASNRTPNTASIMRQWSSQPSPARRFDSESSQDPQRIRDHPSNKGTNDSSTTTKASTLTSALTSSLSLSSSYAPSLLLQDVRLPCAEHLDPDGTMLPTSDWIHVNGTLPLGSLNQIVNSIDTILQEEAHKGIIDLDAEWNPVQDSHVPLVSPDQFIMTRNARNPTSPLSPSSTWIQAAHVVLSPFGRPNGWHVKLPNRSFVSAILERAKQEHFKVDWKTVQVQEYHYSKERQQQEDPAFSKNGGLIVDDSMVRIENCSPQLSHEDVRHLLSRYELAHHGITILKWKGRTNNGIVAPLLYIVRFADASWARAAVRELQSTFMDGKEMKLVPYPQQIRWVEEEDDDDDDDDEKNQDQDHP